MTSSIQRNEKGFEKIWIPSENISNLKLYATLWFSWDNIKWLLELDEIELVVVWNFGHTTACTHFCISEITRTIYETKFVNKWICMVRGERQVKTNSFVWWYCYLLPSKELISLHWLKSKPHQHIQIMSIWSSCPIHLRLLCFTSPLFRRIL